MTIFNTLQLNHLITNTKVNDTDYTFVTYKGYEIKIYCNKQDHRDEIKLVTLSTEYKDFYVGRYVQGSYGTVTAAIKAIEQYLKKTI